MIVKLIEHDLVVIPAGSIMIEGGKPFYRILLKEANLLKLWDNIMVLQSRNLI